MRGSTAAVAVVERATTGMDVLRRRLVGTTAHEAVLADFLEDDLREAQGALASLTGWVASVAEALGDPRATGRELLALAAGDGPFEDLEYLRTTALSLRRRLAQLAVRLPEP